MLVDDIKYHLEAVVDKFILVTDFILQFPKSHRNDLQQQSQSNRQCFAWWDTTIVRLPASIPNDAHLNRVSQHDDPSLNNAYGLSQNCNLSF